MHTLNNSFFENIPVENSAYNAPSFVFRRRRQPCWVRHWRYEVGLTDWTDCSSEGSWRRRPERRLHEIAWSNTVCACIVAMKLLDAVADVTATRWVVFKQRQCRSAWTLDPADSDRSMSSLFAVASNALVIVNICHISAFLQPWLHGHVSIS